MQTSNWAGDCSSPSEDYDAPSPSAPSVVYLCDRGRDNVQSGNESIPGPLLAGEPFDTCSLQLIRERIRSLEDCIMNTSTVDAAHVCSLQKRSSLNENESKRKKVEPRDMGRYLCVSNGFVIYCLDLKRGKDDSEDLQSLPVIDTLHLLEKGHPVSMGLFKVGSDAYMFSGQEFPVYKEHPHLKPHELYKKYGFKGSSRKTYHLSLAVGGLSLSECNIPLLKKPKFWPIVENIGGQIHVIESFPMLFRYPDGIPSHEVLSVDDPGRGWMIVPPMHHPRFKQRGVFISDHLVVGDRIYAKSRGFARQFFVFDCGMNKWEMYEDSRLEKLIVDPKTKKRDYVVHSTKHVTGAFGFENGICLPLVKTASKEQLYVVFAVGTTKIRQKDGYWSSITAVAHLVNGEGLVLCSQSLPDFFEGIKTPSSSFIRKATLFRVEEEQEGEKSPLCCVVLVATDETRNLDFLYVSKFVVEEAGTTNPSSLNFVNALVKETHVYQVGIELQGGADFNTSRLSACFL